MPPELTQEFDFLVKNEFWVQKIKQIEKIDRNFDFLADFLNRFFGVPWVPLGSYRFPGLPQSKKVKNKDFFIFGGPSGIVVGSVVSVEVASLARGARECARRAGSHCLRKLYT